MAVFTPPMVRPAPLHRAVSPRVLALLVTGCFALCGVGLIGGALRGAGGSATAGSAGGGVRSLAAPTGLASVASLHQGTTTPNSGPIALSSDDRFVWMVDPNDNAVTVVRVDGDVNQRVARLRVGVE